MKKFLLSVALLGACGVGSYAQQAGCGTDLGKALQNPDFAAEYAKFNAYLKEHPEEFEEKAGGVRIVPVVVHVIHDGGNSNVPVSSINTMMTKINQAYSKTPPNIGTLPERFDSIAGDAKIEFRLATRDPLGNCTDGIRRVYAPHRSRDTYDDKKFKNLSYWDRARYLNIWLVNNITDPSDAGGGGTILGYCLFPSDAPALRDGATIAYGSMTTQGVVAHELGHHLNLIHMWGDQTCGDDQVDDTPVHRSTNFDWPDPCDTLVKEATCYENVIDNPHDSLLRYAIGENYQNYMDYVNNYNCPNMFTEGQIERMNATLTFYSYRGNMIKPENNEATGTQDNAPACNAKAPVADFWAQTRVVCAGGTVNFRNGSFNGTPDTWAWEFPGGNPATSSSENPQVTYANPGAYPVTLTVTNANGTSTRTKAGVVFVLDSYVESKPWGYHEGFEYGGNYDLGRWTLVNDQTDPGKEWKLSQGGVAYTGDFSIKMENFGNVRDNSSDLISPGANLDDIVGTGKQIRFKVAYAIRTNEDFSYDQSTQLFMPVLDDKLVLSRSSNCGASWVTVKTFDVEDLLSAGLSPNPFTPQDQALWKTITVPLNGSAGTGNNVRFRFEFTSGGPFNNNLYIDDIQIIATGGGATSIEEVTAEALEVQVYPNPITENSVITFTLPASVNKANVAIYDVAGRHVSDLYSGQLAAGTQTFALNSDRLTAGGVYFVKLELDGKTLTEKIIVQ